MGGTLARRQTGHGVQPSGIEPKVSFFGSLVFERSPKLKKSQRRLAPIAIKRPRASPPRRSSTMTRRRPDSSILEDELAAFADNLRDKASRLAPSEKRSDLLNWRHRVGNSPQLIGLANLAGLPPPQAVQRKGLAEQLEKLLCDTADCADFSALASNEEKREFFARLSAQLTQLADEVERVMTATRH
jgi:hypothetical protein